MKNDLRGAEERLSSLLAQQRYCASPGAISQGSQKALPDGEPMEVEEMAQRKRRELSTFTHSSPPPLLPATQPLYAGLSSSSGLFSATVVPEGAIPSGAVALQHLGGAISPIADVVMGEQTNRSKANTPHESMMVTGPQVREQLLKSRLSWTGRKEAQSDLWRTMAEYQGTRRQLLPSEPTTPQVTAERQISDAKFFVQKMNHENAELGQQLAQQTVEVQRAAHDKLLQSNLTEQQRQAETLVFQQLAEGLARAYDEQTRANGLQVLNDRERGRKVNLALQSELHAGAIRYQHMETEAVAEIQKRDGVTNYWRAELEQESQIAVRHSEHSRDVEHRCVVAEQAAQQRYLVSEDALRQKLATKLPKDQTELHHQLMKIEQEAMQHVRSTELKAESAMEKSSREVKLLTEEVFAKKLGLEISTQRGGEAAAEITRLGIQLAQERSSSFSTRQGMTDSQEAMRIVQQQYLDSLTNLQVMQSEYGATLQSFRTECAMYREEVDHSHEEQRLYEATYDCWENLKSSRPAPSVLPPGLPAGGEAGPSAPMATAEAATPDFRNGEVALKTTEADKITAAPYATLTNLMGWQTNSGVAVVHASGIRTVEMVIYWFST